MRMRLRFVTFVAGAALSLGCTASLKAVTFTFSFDFADFEVSTTGAGGNYTSAAATPGVLLTGTPANAFLTVPYGSSFEVGVDALISGPGQDGLTAFQDGIVDANKSIAAVNASATTGVIGLGPKGNHGPIVNPFFFSTSSTGLRNIYSDNAGGVNDGLGMYGSASLTVTTPNPPIGYGNGTSAELYNALEIDTTGPIGSSDVFTADNLNTALLYAVQTGRTTYTPAQFNSSTDTVAPLPTLTLSIGPAPVPEPSLLIATSAFISLTTLRWRRSK